MKNITFTISILLATLSVSAQTKNKIEKKDIVVNSNVYAVTFIDNYATIKHKELPLPVPKPEDAMAFEFQGETLNRPMLIDRVAQLMNKKRDKVNWDRLGKDFFVEITLYVQPVTKRALYASFAFKKDSFTDLSFFENLEKELQNSNLPMTVSPSGTIPVFKRYGYFRSGISINWTDIKDKLDFK